MYTGPVNIENCFSRGLGTLETDVCPETSTRSIHSSFLPRNSHLFHSDFVMINASLMPAFLLKFAHFVDQRFSIIIQF